ncbi:MAG: LytTR family transcriptional regulator DNA-binding domain-containing protein [Lachnospiraceae bacterium]|nr:LytTR family transcriptional regulator DNA-binding domain-containing protein [Lachnospiraceae bacterium]
MQVIKRQVKDRPLTVIIEYPEYTGSVEELFRRISALDISFRVLEDGKQIKVSLTDIYYIENVERKLFIYTEKDVYRYDSSMAEVEAMTSGTGLVRISRTCIMNTEHLKEIKQVRNSHLEAALDNDEMLIVSRKYLKAIKDAFNRGQI